MMGARLLPLALLSACMSLHLRAAIVAADATPAGEPKKWEVTGEWAAKTPDWKGTISIRPDGTFARGMGDGGKWRLTAKDGKAALELNWDKWDTQVLTMLSPDLFRAKVRKGTIELRRKAADGSVAAPPKPEDAWLDEYKDPALKQRLDDSVWRLKDGKRFTLRADGTTDGSWHSRKGRWRIVGANKVQLTINWRPEGPATVSVESNGQLLRWGESEWGQIAKRVEKKAE
jgi:hypothetical protein